jgi:hypothetical protein
MDVVRKVDGRVTIKDLKTGRVDDDDGQIYGPVQRQLRLYGLAVRWLEPEAVIRLVVDDGTEHVIEFDGGVARDVEMWLRDLLDRLPPHTEAEAEDLATVGEWCRWCPFRHVCPAYVSVAPQLWSGGAPFRLPLDIWGRVQAISPRGGLLELDLRDAGGRRVKIFGVDSRRVGSIQSDDTLYFIGLRARLRRSQGGEWHHPLNFYEVSPDGRQDRAWSLEIFREVFE